MVKNNVSIFQFSIPNPLIPLSPLSPLFPSFFFFLFHFYFLTNKKKVLSGTLKNKCFFVVEELRGEVVLNPLNHKIEEKIYLKPHKIYELLMAQERGEFPDLNCFCFLLLCIFPYLIILIKSKKEYGLYQVEGDPHLLIKYRPQAFDQLC